MEKAILEKARKYCAYQERSQQEVRDKLYEWGFHKNEVEQVITQLITENYLSEQRFALAYAGGKFRSKGWGRLKIRQGLEGKRVSQSCITNALKELNESDYQKTMKKIIAERTKAIKEENSFKRNYMIARHTISKGYEPELVWEYLNSQ